MVSHVYGTAAEQVMVEIGRQLADLRDVLCAGDAADGQTLFMLVADHGHSPITEYVNIYDHAPLSEALRCGLAGAGFNCTCYAIAAGRGLFPRAGRIVITTARRDAGRRACLARRRPTRSRARMGDLIDRRRGCAHRKAAGGDGFGQPARRGARYSPADAHALCARTCPNGAQIRKAHAEINQLFGERSARRLRC